MSSDPIKCIELAVQLFKEQSIQNVDINKYVRGFGINKKFDKASIFALKSNLEFQLLQLSNAMDQISEIEDFVKAQIEEVDVHLNNLDNPEMKVELNKNYSSTFLGFDASASWADEYERDTYIHDMVKQFSAITNAPPSASTHVKEYEKTNLGFDFNLPVVKDLNDVPQCMYYYKGAEDEGIYICITSEFYVKIPFPDVDSNPIPDSVIRCEHGDRETCDRKRSEPVNVSDFEKLLMAKKSDKNTGTASKKACSKVHTGESFHKVGSSHRCYNIPGFGKHDGLDKDLIKIQRSDINTMLMYALSDVFLGALWFQRNRKERTVMKDIDKNV